MPLRSIAALLPSGPARRPVMLLALGTFALGTDFTTDGNLLMSADNFVRFFPNPLSPRETRHLAHLGLIQLADGADLHQTRRALRAELPDDVRVLTLAEFIQEERHFWQNATPIGFIFTFGLVIGVIVGMVICSQVLQADVASHLKEYATLKAMGYTSAYLTWVVLQEGLWLGILGFLPSLAACLFLYFGNANAFSAQTHVSGALSLNNERPIVLSQAPPVPPPRIQFS